jgi:hypothetical protein
MAAASGSAGIRFSHLRSLKPSKRSNPAVADLLPTVLSLAKTGSLASSLAAQPATKHLVSDLAEYFVSYSWGMSWNSFVRALETCLKLKSNQDPFLWVDIFR